MLLEVLPWAIGVLVTPTAMIAVILLLMTPRARANGGAMAAGWVISLCLVVVIAYVGVTLLGIENSRFSQKDETAKVVLGVLLLLLSAFFWWRALRKHEEIAMPRWLQAVDSFTPRRSFLVGFAVADVKSLILAAAAMSAAAASSSAGHQAAAFLEFVLIGSLGVLLPLGMYLVEGEGADRSLKRWRDWLIAHNTLIMAILLLVFGLALIGRGLAG